MEKIKNEKIKMEENEKVAYVRVEKAMFQIAEIRGIAFTINDKEITEACDYLSDISPVFLLSIKAYFEEYGKVDYDDCDRLADVANCHEAFTTTLSEISKFAACGYKKTLDEIFKNMEVLHSEHMICNAYERIFKLSRIAEEEIREITI